MHSRRLNQCVGELDAEPQSGKTSRPSAKDQRESTCERRRAPADEDSRTPRERRAEFWDNALRWGVPRYPLWVKCFSVAFFGGPIGLIALIGGGATGVTGATITGSVFVCLAVSGIVAGTRLRRREQAASAAPLAHPQHVRSKRRGR